ncbi:hypothetical protein [Planotetraspora sp. GP83]|uniref:hypothetical protein n=1 Tax=Planotetraspora sp. GP83 TaxID=3156264 RepID=UPI0035130637
MRVLDAPFHAEGAIATAGGCLASVYLAAWALRRTVGETAARAAIDYAAPVGEKQEVVRRVIATALTGLSASARPAERGDRRVTELPA